MLLGIVLGTEYIIRLCDAFINLYMGTMDAQVPQRYGIKATESASRMDPSICRESCLLWNLMCDGTRVRNLTFVYR